MMAALRGLREGVVPHHVPRVSPLQTASGNVEAKVVCFYRRRDISHSLIQLADKHASKWNHGDTPPASLSRISGELFDDLISH